MAKKFHHTVPQMYLKHFADNKSIQVYNKLEDTFSQKNISSATKNKYFYQVPIEYIEILKMIFRKEGTDEANKILKYLEQYGTSLFEELLAIDECKYDKKLTEINEYLYNKKELLIENTKQNKNIEEVREVIKYINGKKSFIAAFIALQIIRTEEFRSFLNRAEAFLRHLMVQVNNIDNIDGIEHIESLEHITHFDSIGGLYSHLKGMLWRMYINDSKQTLFISDNPVIRVYFEECIGLKDNCKLEIKEFCIPLAPDFMFCFFDFLDPRIALLNKFNKHKPPKRSEILDLSKHYPFMLFKKSDLTYYNKLQVFYCTKEVFCKDKVNLELAKKYWGNLKNK